MDDSQSTRSVPVDELELELYAQVVEEVQEVELELVPVVEIL